MKKGIVMHRFIILFILLLSLITSTPLRAQYLLNSDSAFKAGMSNSGRLWGYVFGDFYYKGHSDSSNRGGSNQYTGIPKGRNAFSFRRVSLGYDYNISSKFSAELLLAAEENFPAFNPPTSGVASGDQLTNNKESFYIRLANIRWKNISRQRYYSATGSTQSLASRQVARRKSVAGRL